MKQRFASLEDRIAALTNAGDSLVGLNEHINWESFRPQLNRIHDKIRKSKAGAKSFDVVLMFKILVLQQLHNLSDDRIEYQILDRLSFMRFLGLDFKQGVPDSKTIWLFREQLKNLNLTEILFAEFHTQLASLGYVAREGQMIDATFVEVPKQRNTREENEQIKAGKLPDGWDKDEKKAIAKRRQKDIDARWTKKNSQSYFGYKNHVNGDQKYKLIQSYAVTEASVHDSQVFDVLLDQTVDENGEKRAVYADSAYRSQEQEAKLLENKIQSQICEKGAKNNPLTEEQKQSNRTKSKVRARVEHIFGAQAAMGGHFVRTIGLARAKVKIGMMNLVYNMVRLVQLIKIDTKQSRRKVAPIAA